MRKLLLIGCLMGLLFGCGDKISDPPDNTDQLLIGMWDSVSNTPTACHERIRLNSDATFWWYKDAAISSGTYARGQGTDSGLLNFMFTNAAWEMLRFTVTDRELDIVRVGINKVYARVPSTLANNISSLCPTERTLR